MSDEEKKAIDLLKNIDKQKCVMLECPVVKNNIERQLKIIELNRIIRKQSKEIEELKAKNEQRLTRLFEYEDRLEIYEYKVFNELNNYINMDELQKLDRIGLKGKIYISEDKIKTRIKELEEYLYKGNIKDDFLMIRIKAKIQELQSLLEKE